MTNETNHQRSIIFPSLVCGFSSLFVLFQCMLQTSTSVMIKDLKAAFSINILGVSLLASCFFYTYLLLQIPAGMLVDRFGARKLLTGSLILTAIACILFAKTEILTIAVASRILLGISCAPSVVAALYLMARWFPSRYFALIAGLMEMLGMLGGAAGESLIARSVTLFGWRETLLVCGLIAVFLAILMWIIVRDSPKSENILPVLNQENSWKNLVSVVSLPQAWINGIYTGLVFALLAAFAGFWCIPYLMHRYDIELSVAADASATIFVGAAIGAPLFGWWSDRIGKRRLPMIIAGGILLIITLLVLYLNTVTIAAMFGLLFALGLFSGVYVLPFAVMRDITTENVRGTAMGYTNMMCIAIGAPMLQPLIGWILDQKPDQYESALFLLPMCMAVALVLAFLVRETNCGVIPAKAH